MNKVFLIGRICNEIKLKYTQSNVAIAGFTLVINRPKQKDKEQEADFINIVVWKTQAENCKKYLSKGSQVAIDGKIQTRSYDDQNGNRKYITEIVADNVEFLSVKQDGQQSRQESVNKSQKQDPYEEMGRQVALDDFPNIDDEKMPFQE